MSASRSSRSSASSRASDARHTPKISSSLSRECSMVSGDVSQFSQAPYASTAYPPAPSQTPSANPNYASSEAYYRSGSKNPPRAFSPASSVSTWHDRSFGELPATPTPEEMERNHLLGPDPVEAQRRFAEWMSGQPPRAHNPYYAGSDMSAASPPPPTPQLNASNGGGSRRAISVSLATPRGVSRTPTLAAIDENAYRVAKAGSFSGAPSGGKPPLSRTDTLPVVNPGSQGSRRTSFSINDVPAKLRGPILQFSEDHRGPVWKAFLENQAKIKKHGGHTQMVETTAGVPTGMVEARMPTSGLNESYTTIYFEPVHGVAEKGGRCATPMKDCLRGFGLKDAYERIIFPPEVLSIQNGIPSIKFAVKWCAYPDLKWEGYIDVMGDDGGPLTRRELAHRVVAFYHILVLMTEIGHNEDITLRARADNPWRIYPGWITFERMRLVSIGEVNGLYTANVRVLFDNSVDPRQKMQLYDPKPRVYEIRA